MNLGFFASHGGSNMQAVIDAVKTGELNAKPALLISNNRNSQATARAKLEKIPFQVFNSITHPEPDLLDLAILDELQKNDVELIILAGFLKKIGPRVIKKFDGRIINIHPALLPKFGGRGMFGQNVHRAVLDAKELVTGVSIHLVTSEYDQGRIIAQSEIPVLPGDNIESLAARVLAIEHRLLVKTLVDLTTGKIQLSR